MDLQPIIKAVQTKLGLTADGKAGPLTWAAITRAINATAIEKRWVNNRGLTLVKEFEGLRLSAYRDEVGAWTIGYGHTGLQHQDGTVYMGRQITGEEADALLSYDLEQFSARVETFVKVPVDDNQFAALVSFDFNTGALRESTLLKLLNSGEHFAAAEQFGRWIKAGGTVLNGLIRRRASERLLFEGKTPFIVPG